MPGLRETWVCLFVYNINDTYQQDYLKREIKHAIMTMIKKLIPIMSNKNRKMYKELNKRQLTSLIPVRKVIKTKNPPSHGRPTHERTNPPTITPTP